MKTAEEQWTTAWLRGGKISEVAWINQDTLAWCSGTQLVFLDVPTRKLLLPRFSFDIVAAGASALSGHPSHQVFAFAETVAKPRVLVYTYPSMTKLSECVKSTSHACLATAFVGDFLVTLGSIPDFKMIIWLWRTGDKISSVDTFVSDIEKDGQRLRISSTYPTFIAQIGHASGKLYTWEMIVCHKMIILNENEIVLPAKAHAKGITWCSNSNYLAIIDDVGNVYLSDSTGARMKLIIQPQKHTAANHQVLSPLICWHDNGLVVCPHVGGITYYKKVNNNWLDVWTVHYTYAPSVLTCHHARSDRLFYVTRNGHIVKINCMEENPQPELSVIHCLRGKYLFIEFVQPREEHIVAIDVSMALSVIEVEYAAEVASLKLESNKKVTCMVSHPSYPLVVACTEAGTVVFVSLLDYSNPKVLGKYQLQTEPLDLMKFSSSGRFLLVCHKSNGVCYAVTLSSTNSVEIVCRLDTNVSFIDFILFESRNDLVAHFLQESSKVSFIGHRMMTYELKYKTDVFKKDGVIHDFNKYYQNFYVVSDEGKTFFGSPYVSKQIRFFSMSGGKDVACFDAKSNGHVLRHAKLFYSKDWLISSTLDGSIIVRKLVGKSSLQHYLITHRRREVSLVKAAMNGPGNLLITLGVNGLIVGFRYYQKDGTSPVDKPFGNFYEILRKIPDNPESGRAPANVPDVFDAKEVEFLSEAYKGFDESGDPDAVWTEWKRLETEKAERKQASANKEKIVGKLKALKSKIGNLLNKNESYPSFKKLPISAFALNKVSREKMIKSAKDQREEVMHKLESDCQQMERVIDWIKATYWDMQLVLGKSLFGIFAETEIQNYTVTEALYAKPVLFTHHIFLENVFKEFISDRTIYPWDILPASDVKLLMESQVVIKDNDVDNIDRLFDSDEENEGEDYYAYSLEGLTVDNFIRPVTPGYSQYKSYANEQFRCTRSNIEEDCVELRLYMNKKFDEIYLMKQREMNLVNEGAERIHHICTELYNMFNVVFDSSNVFPKWHVREQPELIVDFQEWEIGVRPYVSPSVQELQHKQALEEERARLALLADDFRDRAIQSMMDGVLETKWEDRIKKDPPLPNCMIKGKKVEEYTDEDMQQVKRYEQSLKNVEMERERYRKILQSDYAKIKLELEKGTFKFNKRIEELHLMKLKVEAAILQLNLLYVRGHAKRLKHAKGIRDDAALKTKIAEKKEAIEKLGEYHEIMGKLEKELHNRYDDLIAKDKLMEKKFRSDFPGLKKIIISALFVQYKRRPRVNLKAATVFEILDLGKSVTGMKALEYLTAECLDYFNQLTILDHFHANLPAAVDETHWQNVVALRRLKIDHELRMRATESSIEHAKEICESMDRQIRELRQDIEASKERLNLDRKERNERDLDMEIQMVFKMGQLEVLDLRGDLYKDLRGAIVVRKQDIECVNNAIVVAGKAKLRAIRRNLNFRRDIEEGQWSYDCLKTRIRHLQDELYYTRTASLTRETRSCLTKFAGKYKEDKTPQKMKREFDARRKSHEKIIADYKTKTKNVYEETERLRKKNEKLEEKITKLNIQRCEMELQRDVEGEIRHKDFRQKILKLIAKRSSLVRKLLDNHEELSELLKKKQIQTSIDVPFVKEADMICPNDNTAHV